MSISTEEYLEAIYNLTQNGQPVSTSALSKRLKIAPASVTEMLRKLAEDDYVNYSPYQGVTLNAKGRAIGERITRKHRLLERFLHDTLKIGNEKVHAEACAMEHALSDEAERALCQTLKAPDKCPDDNKLIPPCDLEFRSCQECNERGVADFSSIEKRKSNVVALSALKKKQEGTIAFIRGENRVLGRLRDMGLTPGTRISVTRVAPLKGPVEIAIRGSKLALSDAIAGNVFINKSDEGPVIA
jgi:DtxR family transcriptional regulator, Mn-dependent transcriptional regulator